MKSLFYTIVSFLLLSCSTSQDNSIYVRGSEFLYEVEISDGNNILDTQSILLRVPSEGVSRFTYGQTGIQYLYITLSESDGDTLTEVTGVVESSDKIYLHPPRKDFMAFAEIPPQPQISLPLKVGNYSETELKIAKGWGELNGKKIKQSLKVAGGDELKMYGHSYDSLWLIEGKNISHLNELGQYSVTYWFDEKLGFIRMKYTKPDSTIVDLKLKKFN